MKKESIINKKINLYLSITESFSKDFLNFEFHDGNRCCNRCNARGETCEMREMVKMAIISFFFYILHEHEV